MTRLLFENTFVRMKFAQKNLSSKDFCSKISTFEQKLLFTLYLNKLFSTKVASKKRLSNRIASHLDDRKKIEFWKDKPFFLFREGNHFSNERGETK